MDVDNAVLLKVLVGLALVGAATLATGFVLLVRRFRWILPALAGAGLLAVAPTLVQQAAAVLVMVAGVLSTSFGMLLTASAPRPRAMKVIAVLATLSFALGARLLS